jgi:hypothetical protein
LHPLLLTDLMTRITENPLQFLANLRFSTLALTGPMANADHR